MFVFVNASFILRGGIFLFIFKTLTYLFILNIEEIRNYALLKREVTEGFPFGESTLVLKTGGKIFLLAGLDAQPLSINLKCEPDKAEELREEFPENILPGYHMNKKHWNTLVLDGRLRNSLIKELIDHSYHLVFKPKKK